MSQNPAPVRAPITPSPLEPNGKVYVAPLTDLPDPFSIPCKGERKFTKYNHKAEAGIKKADRYWKKQLYQKKVKATLLKDADLPPISEEWLGHLLETPRVSFLNQVNKF